MHNPGNFNGNELLMIKIAMVNLESIDTVNINRQTTTDIFNSCTNGDYGRLRKQAQAILQQENELSEMVQLVGKDSLSEDQKLVLENARILREDFLQQNAYTEYDHTCPLEKTVGMLKKKKTRKPMCGMYFLFFYFRDSRLHVYFFNYILIPGGTTGEEEREAEAGVAATTIVGLFVVLLSSVIGLIPGLFRYGTVFPVITNTTDNNGVINGTYYPRSSGLSTTVVDGFLDDYNGFYFGLRDGLRAPVLATTNNNERKKKYDGVSSTTSNTNKRKRSKLL